MVCCLFCFSSDPVEDDPRAYKPAKFDITMAEGAYKNQPWCILTYFCAPCSTYLTRYRSLDSDLSTYTCCQGYYDGFCGFRSGRYCESRCPQLMLALESCCCLGPSMSASRLFVMDTYNLRSDEWDNRLIHMTNFLMIFSCGK